MRANLRPPALYLQEASLQIAEVSRKPRCALQVGRSCRLLGAVLDTVAQANRTAGMPDAELVGRPALRGCSPRAGPRVGLWVQVQALWRPPRALPWDFVEKIEQRLVRKSQGGCKGKGSETEPAQILAICYQGADQYIWWHALFTSTWGNNISPPPPTPPKKK